MQSKPKVTINLLNKEAQDRVDWISSPNKSFGNIDLLDDISKSSPDFLNLSLNDSVLDSSLGYQISNVAFMSASLSDADCFFDDVWVEGDLHEETDFFNLTIDFGNNFPKKIKIEQLFGLSVVDTEIIDNINESVIYSSHPAIECDGIKITFIESWAPFQYAHLQALIIGSVVIFDSSRISSMSLVEDTDPISNKLEIDTASIEIIHQKDEFNLLNPKNISLFIKPGLPVDIEITIVEDDFTEIQHIGTYYVKSVKFDSNVFMKLECETFLGLMEKAQFIQSRMYNGNLPQDSAKNVIDSIFDATFDNLGISHDQRDKYYNVDDDIADIKCYGYIPVMSCRDALRHVCFVNCLRVQDNRNNRILIKITEPEEIYDVDDPDMFIESNDITNTTTFDLVDNVKSITATSHSYTLDDEEYELKIYKDGVYFFDYPSYVTSVEPESGHSSSEYSYESGLLYFKITFSGEPFEVTVIFKRYSDSTLNYQLSKDIDGKKIELGDSRLITKDNVDQVLTNASKFLVNNKLKLNTDYVNTTQVTGGVAKVSLLDKTFTGFLTHQNVDVAEGMITRCEIIGRQLTLPRN